LDFPEVVADFRKNTGKQFAPEAVVALFRAILREVEGGTRERTFSRLLGRDYLRKDESQPLVVELLAELETDKGAAVGST
jgi:hypothetical protein